MTIDSEKKKNLEIEIKIKIDDSDINDIKKRILKGKFTLVTRDSFEHNTVFDTKDGRLKRSKILLRLRNRNNKNILTLKRPSSKAEELKNYKIREEIEAEVSDFENTKTILMALGFEIFFIYEKYREVYKKGKIKIMVDRTPIGNFLEIEGEVEEIDQTAAQLGFDKSDYITTTYYTLFRKKHKSGFMQFK